MTMTGADMHDEQARRASSKTRIFAALREAGMFGCTNGELNAISFRYGARVLELRRVGHDIESIDEGAGRWRFVLHVPARVSAPVVASVAPVDAPQPGCLF